MLTRILRFIALSVLLAFAGWVGHATALRRMSPDVWNRPQPFPDTSQVWLTELAPFAADTQKPLRDFLFARENQIAASPGPGSGIRTLTPGMPLTFLGADAGMGWVRDGAGTEFWVPLGSLRSSPSF